MYSNTSKINLATKAMERCRRSRVVQRACGAGAGTISGRTVQAAPDCSLEA